ncbi:DedA family protein [Oecophyllibacter saccharovorans]|nr:DedA family protein [Oecophyllibacter saccharovorans]
MLESMGLPLPAESLLVLCSLYAAHTHRLDIWAIMAAGCLGAMAGDNFGYLIGHFWGRKLLEKHGPKVGISRNRLILGEYLAKRFGGWAVLFGRFVAIMRLFIAILAGATRMPWHIFLFFNAAGAILWAGGYSLITYQVGKEIEKLTGPIGIVLGCLVVIGAIAAILALRRNERHLMALALADARQGELLVPGMPESTAGKDIDQSKKAD